MKDYLEIGKIVNTHGLKGELKVMPWCDDISVFEQVGMVTVNEKEYEIRSVVPHKHSYLVKLSGIETIEQAQALKNHVIQADKKNLPPLPEGIYYITDLIGLSVFDETGCLGTLTDYIETGSNDVYVVTDESGKELLLPAIKEVIRKVDLAAGRMDVVLMEGLRGDED